MFFVEKLPSFFLHHFLHHYEFIAAAVCNYAKGRWVADSARPLYSGFQCKQWLSEMWACRLTQRPDFAFEGYRWQPENCKVLNFERSSFLKRWLFFSTKIFISFFIHLKNISAIWNSFMWLLCRFIRFLIIPILANVAWIFYQIIST